MTLDELRSLYEYNAWANRRTLGACAALSPEQFARDLGSSFPSVRDTLGHIFGAEWIWHERWHGRSPSGPPAGLATVEFADLRSRLDTMDRDLLAYVGSLSEVDLLRALEYRNMAGKEFRDRLDHTLRHLVNHGSYHRGQITTLLRQLGAKAVSTDLIAYHREQGKGATA